MKTFPSLQKPVQMKIISVIFCVISKEQLIIVQLSIGFLSSPKPLNHALDSMAQILFCL